MSFTLTGTIAGTAVTGAATPVYTLTEDSAAGPNMRRWYVTTVATANSANAHLVSSPFYIELIRPASFKSGPVYDQTGSRVISGQNNRNTYRIRVAKGVQTASGLTPAVMLLDMAIHVPAGADVNDAANVRVALSLLGGFINEDSANLCDTFVNGLVG